MLLTSWEELLLRRLSTIRLSFDEAFANHLVVLHLYPVLYEEMGMRTFGDRVFFVDYCAYGMFSDIPADVVQHEIDALVWVRKIELCINKSSAVYTLTIGNWRQLANTDVDVSARPDEENPDYNALGVRYDAIAKIRYVVL
jgi:hypothetical protein